MTSKRLATAAVALLVVLAGCAGAPLAPSGTTDGPQDNTDTPSAGSDSATNAGTINFYISDERNAINDFEHLNVTISKVGFHMKGADDDENETDEANETDDENVTTSVTDGGTTTAETPTTQTTTAELTATAESMDMALAQDANATTTANQSTTTANGTNDEAETEDAEEDDGEFGGDSWVVKEVDNRTIDLTQYQGANATLLEEFDVPNGTYNKVFIFVSEVNGTLNETGESVNVKLPSERLHINKQFTVGNNESVDFVFDVTVFKAGKSGKYILKPVVSQSGTDVPIEVKDNRGPPEDAGPDGEPGPPDDAGPSDDEDDESDSTNLSVALQGQPVAGENVTVRVTSDGGPVAGAAVSVNGEDAGTTGDNGTLEITVPDAEELEIEVEVDDADASLERQIQQG